MNAQIINRLSAEINRTAFLDAHAGDRINQLFLSIAFNSGNPENLACMHAEADVIDLGYPILHAGDMLHVEDAVMGSGILAQMIIGAFQLSADNELSQLINRDAVVIDESSLGLAITDDRDAVGDILDLIELMRNEMIVCPCSRKLLS